MLSIANDHSTPLFVATHSPMFLRHPSVNSVLLTREGDSGSTLLDRSPWALARSAEDLGLSPTDVLHLYRVFLLVEGRHDELVLGELLGEQLIRHRVLVIPLHGGRHVPRAADSRILADYTDQRVIALVDNVDARPVHELAAQAATLPLGDVAGFERLARALLPERPTDETQWLRCESRV